MSANTFSVTRVLIGRSNFMRYAVGKNFGVHTALIIHPDGKKVLLVPALEFSEARQKAQADEVLNIEIYRDATEKKFGSVSIQACLLEYLQQENMIQITMPGSSEAGQVDFLRNGGVQVNLMGGLFFPEMEVKTPDEIEKIREAQEANEEGFWRIIEILQQSTIAAGNTLVWQTEVLTSEILRDEAEAAIKKAGNGKHVEGGPIVACKTASANPHDEGSGPLMAGELILVDIYPMHANGYFGDLTRTFVKGTPKAWQVEMYETVRDGQLLAELLIVDGASGQDIDNAVRALFKKRGFPTDYKAPYGYIHSLGHFIGMILHEAPGISHKYPRIHKAGNVVTNEPGLYYNGNHPTRPEIVGGVRIEDIVVVTKNGCENLTTIPKILEVDKIKRPGKK